jgi:ECF sigma factor
MGRGQHAALKRRFVGDQRFDGRGHFFAAGAEAMRRILVEAARRKQAQKHGGGGARVALDAADGVADPAGPDTDDRLVALDSALARPESEEPQAAAVVNLRRLRGVSLAAARCLGFLFLGRLSISAPRVSRKQRRPQIRVGGVICGVAAACTSPRRGTSAMTWIDAH